MAKGIGQVVLLSINSQESIYSEKIASKVYLRPYPRNMIINEELVDYLAELAIPLKMKVDNKHVWEKISPRAY